MEVANWIGSIGFFRHKLVQLKEAEILPFLDEHYADQRLIEEEIYTMVYHLQGSITLSEAWEMSAYDRNKCVEVVNKIRAAENDQNANSSPAPTPGNPVVTSR